MTALLAFVDQRPWWSLVYMVVLCWTLILVACAIGGKK